MLQQTPSQTVGPFFSYGLFHGGENVLVNDRTRGERISLTGQVLDGDGEPVTDAMIEIWQPDANGYFRHPKDPNHTRADPHFKGFGRSESVDNGTYRFDTLKPGPIGNAAPYINVRIFARGLLIHAVTRVYFADEDTNDTDPVLKTVDSTRRKTLLAQRAQVNGATVYRRDIILQGDEETVFFNV